MNWWILTQDQGLIMEGGLCIIPAWQTSDWINLGFTPKKELASIISPPVLGSCPPFKNVLLPLLDKADIYTKQPGLLLSRRSEGSTAVITRWADVQRAFPGPADNLYSCS